MGYDGFCRDLDADQVAAFVAEGRSPVVRFRMPDRSVTFDDLVRGEVTFRSEHVPDYALARANGQPLYTLVNPLDDAMMGITHVLRGEDLLSSTPRQIALYEALIELGIAQAVPRFGHLPYVMGEGNKKLSKRDPQASLLGYREAGFLPEGLLNYLALLGWAIAEDRDVFSLDEMVAAFDIARVNPNPARFDLKKAEAINAAHMRLLSVSEMAERVVPHLVGAGVLERPAHRLRARPAGEGDAARARADEQAHGGAGDARLPLHRRRWSTTRPTSPSCSTTRAAGSSRPPTTPSPRLDTWTTEAIDEALRATLVEGLGLKPRNAFGPVRVAVTGRRISPPLFESLELLGREVTLARLATAPLAATGA